MQKIDPSQQVEPNGQTKTQTENESFIKTRFQFAILFAAALVTTLLPMPFNLVAALFTLWAAILGISYLIKRSPDKKKSPRETTQIVFGVVAALFISSLVGSTVLRWDIDMNYQSCLNQAVTHSAQQQCIDSYQKELKDSANELLKTPLPE